MASFAKDDNNNNNETTPLINPEGKIFTNEWSSDCNPVTGSILNKQNLRLATFYYPVKGRKKVKGTILAIHGYGAHCHWEYMGYPYNTYKNGWVENFNNNGYNVLTYDHQSHGLSQDLIPGVRCYIDRFDDLIDDALQIYYERKKNATLIRFVSDNVPPIRNCKRSGTIFGRTWLAVKELKCGALSFNI